MEINEGHGMGGQSFVCCSLEYLWGHQGLMTEVLWLCRKKRVKFTGRKRLGWKLKGTHWGIKISRVLLIERNENKESIQREEFVSFSQRNTILVGNDAQKPWLHRFWTEKPISLMGIPLTESNRQPASQPYLVDSHMRERTGAGTLEGWVYEQNHKAEKLPSAVQWVAPEGIILSDTSRQRKAPMLFLKHECLERKAWSWL